MNKDDVVSLAKFIKKFEDCKLDEDVAREILMFIKSRENYKRSVAEFYLKRKK